MQGESGLCCPLLCSNFAHRVLHPARLGRKWGFGAAIAPRAWAGLTSKGLRLLTPLKSARTMQSTRSRLNNNLLLVRAGVVISVWAGLIFLGPNPKS